MANAATANVVEPAAPAPAPGAADSTPSKLRVVHGPVSTVRAVPSREVSVISVEIPEEHHVQATSLVHGQYALITRSPLGAGTVYGILDIDIATQDMDTAAGPTTLALAGKPPSSIGMVMVHARVALVRPVPSRMLSIVYLEVPEGQHVEVTNLLHGRDAILFPVKLKNIPLGIMAGAPVCRSDPLPSSPGTGLPARRMSSSSSTHVAGRSAAHASTSADAEPSGLLSRSGLHGLAVTRWLGAQCASEAFQDFLGVRNEAAAKAKVCQLCGVESRSEIRDNPRAMAAFLSQIYRPFDTRNTASA